MVEAYTCREVNFEWVAVLLAGGSLIVSLTILFVGWHILRSTRRAERGSEERLEILREQQERLRVHYQERRMLQEELERLRRTMAEVEHKPLELLPASESKDSELHNGAQRRWWAFWR